MNSIQVFKPDIQKEIGNLDPITDAEQICTLRWVKKHALSVITEEEIVNRANNLYPSRYTDEGLKKRAFIDCWKYILSRINQ